MPNDGQFERWRPARRIFEFGDVDFFDLFYFALRLFCFRRFVAKPVDVRLLVRNIRFDARDFGLLAFTFGQFFFTKRRIIAVVERNRAVIDIENVRRDVVEKSLVVRNHEHDPFMRVQKLFEPSDRQNIQMVCRFVQQQDVGTTHEHLSEQHAQLEATRQSGERFVMNVRGNREAHEDRCGSRTQRVAIVCANHIGQLGETMRITSTVVDDAFFFFESRPNDAVAHHREVDDAQLVVEKSVLTKHAHARATSARDGSFGGLIVARENFEQRAFA